MKPVFELCAGSLNDCLLAQKHGANRIELNCALAAGGLSPSAAVLDSAKKQVSIPIICMVRPREAGFCYSETEAQLMFEEARLFLEHGADGIAFGFLNPDGTIDEKNTQTMISLIHSYPGRTAVFHRAIDVCTSSMDEAVQTLIRLGADRILTSEQKPSAIQSAELLARLQREYGDKIQILAGSGINAENVKDFLQKTGLKQVHSSCKGYQPDPTTCTDSVSFAFYGDGRKQDYMQADSTQIEAFARAVLTAEKSEQN